MKKNWTGERLETFINTRDTIDHLHRYSIARNYVQNKVILDIASGEGYGSNLLSQKATFVYGVDIDKVTVENAKNKYIKKNLTFIEGRADLIPLEDNLVDVVISFETIEHHDKHTEMLLEIKRVLKPNGILIISTPDKFYYSDKGNFNNSFHIKELYKDEFIALIGSHFKKYQILNQKYINGNSLITNEIANNEIQFYNGNFENINTINPDPLYLISIASDGDFKTQTQSLFDGTLISQEEVKNIIQNTNSYKIGHFILLPLKFLKRILK